MAWGLVEDGAIRIPEVRILVADLRRGTVRSVADLRRGTVRSVADLPGAPAPGLPATWSMAQGHLVYTTQDGQATTCIADLELATGKARVVYCTDRKEQGAGFPSYGSGGVTFNEWTPGPTPDGCRSVLVARGPSVKEVPALKPCRPFSAVTLEGSAVFWGEQHPSTPEYATFFASLPDGSLQRFATCYTATEIVCDGWVYWVIPAPGEIHELRRWQPGAQVQVVYRNTKRWLLLSKPRCAGDRVTATRFPNVGGEVQLIEALIP